MYLRAEETANRAYFSRAKISRLLHKIGDWLLFGFIATASVTMWGFFVGMAVYNLLVSYNIL